MEDQVSIPLPRYVLPRIATLRDKLLNTTFIEYYGAVLEQAWLESLVSDIKKALPGKIHPNVLEDSLRTVAGTLFTEIAGKQLAWRLAGNLDQLKANNPVHPWIRQHAEEWVPVEVLDATPGENLKRQQGATFSLRVWAGTPCPMILKKFWTTRFIHYISRRVGFSSSYGVLPMAHIVELVRLRLFVLLTPERSREVPGFEQLACPSSMVAYNQAIIAMRRRVDWQCPASYTHHCFQCAVGYRDCPAATHRDTLCAQPASPAAL